jgi:hypothetical protein
MGPSRRYLLWVTSPGGSTTRAKCYLGRSDNFVEQREHRSMTPRVVDMNEHDCVVTWTQGFEPKLVSHRSHG